LRNKQDCTERLAGSIKNNIEYKIQGEDMKERINKILNDRVKPILENHKGDIRLINVENNTVEVQMLGACSGCASASDTLQEIVLVEIQKEIPEINEVVMTTVVSEDLLDMARNILNRDKEIKR
jgi:Fe-S cluster biogenesis protein NfuA